MSVNINLKKYLAKIINKIFTTVTRLQIIFSPKKAFQKKSYSQEGEDLVLSRFFEQAKNGFYLDIGAHHPYRFSNTFLFYERGWRGINIDAMPGSMILFNKARKNDINLETGVGIESGEMTYYIFNEPALNTFSQSQALEYEKSKHYFIKEKKVIPIKRLDEILDKYMPIGQSIDFMSIDVEGFDLQVLMSNNWQKYRPEIILVESLVSKLEEIESCSIYQFMKKNNYILLSKTINTFIYKNSIA